MVDIKGDVVNGTYGRTEGKASKMIVLAQVADLDQGPGPRFGAG